MAIFKNLTKWQNYVHYFLNVGFLYLQAYFLFKVASIDLNFITFFVLVGLFFVNDTIIHFLFSIAPKPLQWRD